MEATDQTVDGGRPSLAASLVGGALIGGAFGVFEAVVGAGRVLGLPVASQLAAVSLGWCIAAATGLILAGTFECFRRLVARFGGIEIPAAVWAGWFAFAAYACIEMLARASASASYGLVAAAAVVTPVLFGTLNVLGGRYPRLRSTALWSTINLAGLFVVLLWLAFAGPVRHGVDVSGFVLALSAIVLVTLAFLSVPSRAMRRRAVTASVFLTALLAFALFAVPALWRGAPAKASARPNVVLVTIDTLRDDHLGCYGSGTVRTPHIDEFAGQGVLFEHTITPIPLTNPSHTSILTGLYPANHGVVLNRPMSLAPGVTTLPAILSRHGYKTAAFVAGFTLKRDSCCLVDEFDVYGDDFSGVALLPEPVIGGSVPRLLFELARYVGVVGSVPIGQRPAGPVVDCAERWLDANAEAPFFLWVHMFDPHGGYEPPPPYDTMYDPDYSGTVGGDWYALTRRQRMEVIESPRDLAHIKALYAGEVSYADEQVGRLLSTLSGLGLDDRTLVIVTSDHGESLTEHDYYFDHTVCLYDPSLKVPLIFRFPGGEPAGRRCHGLVQLIDICPTILDYLGISETPAFDGASLIRQCVGASDKFENEIAISTVFTGEIVGGKSLLSIRTPHHKYIRTSPWFGDLLLIPGKDELYDLAADPGELRDLSEVEPEMLEGLRELGDEYWEAWLLPKVPEPKPISPQAAETLRSLGYLE